MRVSGILSFFDNIGVTKLYICVHFCDYWQNKSFFVDLLYILFGCLPIFATFMLYILALVQLCLYYNM